MTTPVDVVVADGIATITIGGHQAANALDLPAMKTLGDAAVRCDEDDAVRAVVLTGRGRYFCAGGDIAAFNACGADLAAFIEELRPASAPSSRACVA